MASILKVNTIQDATNSTTAISVDTAGRVTTPARPYFLVNTTGTQSTTANSSATAAVVQFSSVEFNVGSHWSTSNHNFVAPVNGIYQFNAMLLLNNVANGDDEIHVFFQIDSSVKNFFARSPGEAANGGAGYGGFLHVQGSASYYLTANQTIDIRYRADGGEIGVFGSSTHSHFSGYLVG